MKKIFASVLLALACTTVFGQAVKDSAWNDDFTKIEFADSKWDMGLSVGATYNYSFNAPAGLSNNGWGLDLSLFEMHWKGWQNGYLTLGILDMMFDWQYLLKGNKFTGIGGGITPALDGTGHRADFQLGFPIGINQQFGKDFGISLQAVPGIGLHTYVNEYNDGFDVHHKEHMFPNKDRVGFRLNLKATLWYGDFGVLVRYNPLASKDLGTTILSVGITFRD